MLYSRDETHTDAVHHCMDNRLAAVQLHGAVQRHCMLAAAFFYQLASTRGRFAQHHWLTGYLLHAHTGLPGPRVIVANHRKNRTGAIQPRTEPVVEPELDEWDDDFGYPTTPQRPNRPE